VTGPAGSGAILRCKAQRQERVRPQRA